MSKLITQDQPYAELVSRLEVKGKQFYKCDYSFNEEDLITVNQLICYFIKDQSLCDTLGVNLNKGICLAGPIGSGKSSIMNLIARSLSNDQRYIIKPCRDISFEFMKEGYETILKHSIRSFDRFTAKVYCYDDLGAENTLKFFGNETNIMAEILLSRYDLFLSRGLITHLTTNLSASEIESLYGQRVRSRMREAFNFITLVSGDKRK